MKKFLLLLFSCFLTSCIVLDESQYYDPIYREHVVIYDVWPQTAPFYNFNNTTYIYQKPTVYGPRNNPHKPRKPRQPKKKVVERRK